MGEQTVESVMTGDVCFVRPATPVHEVLEIMVHHRVSAVPVVDDKVRLLGVVSDVDVLAAGGRSAATAAELMGRGAPAVPPTEPIAAAARKLRHTGARRLFVVDRDRTLVGAVARRDLLRPFLRSDEDISNEIVERLAAWRADDLNFPPVSVTVVAGESTLDGAMLLRSTTELVRRLASSVPGVVAVHSNLTYEIDD